MYGEAALISRLERLGIEEAISHLKEDPSTP